MVTLSADCLRALQGLWEEKLGQVSIKLLNQAVGKVQSKTGWKGGRDFSVALSPEQESLLL